MEGLHQLRDEPVNNGPNSRKMVYAALAKLKWLVVAENFETETADFWKPEILALAGKKPEDVKTEVFLLPAANFAEKVGLLHQLGSLDPVEVEGHRPARRGQARPGDHRPHLPEGAGTVPEGGRPVPRPRPQAQLVVHSTRRMAPPRRRSRSP
jgi:hypothetical protein